MECDKFVFGTNIYRGGTERNDYFRACNGAHHFNHIIRRVGNEVVLQCDGCGVLGKGKIKLIKKVEEMSR